MSKVLVSAALLALLVFSATAACAQDRSVVTVRQGDTIEWVVQSAPPHKVRFGGPGTTSVTDAGALLEFTPPLVPGPGGVGDSNSSSSGTLVTAKVKDDAAPGKTFVFNCGIHSGGQMISLRFEIEAKVAGEPARTHRVIGGPGLHWHLHLDVAP